VEEALIEAQDAVVTDKDAAVVLQPGEGPLDFPASSIAPQLPAILSPPWLPIAAMGNE